jgi:hypothetical protein
MADEIDSLRVRVQELVTTGGLPCQDCLVTWYGEGRGHRCAACDQRILDSDMEIECDVPGGDTIHFHLACYGVWQATIAGKE